MVWKLTQLEDLSKDIIHALQKQELKNSRRHKGGTQSEETKKKVQATRLGLNAINLCECGCGEIVKNRFVIGHHMRMPENKFINKGRSPSIETRKKISIANTGNTLTNEQKQKISDSKIGKRRSEETKKKISDAHIGKILSEEHKKNIGIGGKGKILSEETKKKIGDSHRGDKSNLWMGGVWKDPYCRKFTNSVREKVRDKYNRKCFICDKHEKDNFTKAGVLWRLSVHHVDMNKNQGCDEHEWRLIPVCIQCHTKLHSDLMKDRLLYLLKVETEQNRNRIKEKIMVDLPKIEINKLEDESFDDIMGYLEERGAYTVDFDRVSDGTAVLTIVDNGTKEIIGDTWGLTK